MSFDTSTSNLLAIIDRQISTEARPHEAGLHRLREAVVEMINADREYREAIAMYKVSLIPSVVQAYAIRVGEATLRRDAAIARIVHCGS